jgi:DNA-directed RNA polymerase subunit RPC12/RpoP
LSVQRCPSRGCSGTPLVSTILPTWYFCSECKTHKKIEQDELTIVPIPVVLPLEEEEQEEYIPQIVIIPAKKPEKKQTEMPQEKRSPRINERECNACGKYFRHQPKRGRPPTRCPKCRA